jgi:hypothetical protein
MQGNVMADKQERFANKLLFFGANTLVFIKAMQLLNQLLIFFQY